MSEPVQYLCQVVEEVAYDPRASEPAGCRVWLANYATGRLMLQGDADQLPGGPFVAGKSYRVTIEAVEDEPCQQ